MNSNITDKELKEYKHFGDIPDVIAYNHLLAALAILIYSFISIVAIFAALCFIFDLLPAKSANILICFMGGMVLIALTVICYLITLHKRKVLMERYFTVRYLQL